MSVRVRHLTALIALGLARRADGAEGAVQAGIFIPAGDHPLHQPDDVARGGQFVPELRGRIGAWPLPALGLEAEADLGVAATAVLGGARGGLALRLPGDELRVGALGGVGVLGMSGADGGLDPALHAGAFVEMQAGARSWIRADLREYVVVPGLSPRYAAAIGVAWGPRERVPEPIVAAPPAPPPVRARLPELSPPDARVWIAHPICAWVTPAEADAAIANLPPGTQIKVVRPGYLPAEAALGDGAVTLQPAPPTGGVLVAGRPGDQVRFGEGPWLSVGPDGTLVASLPAGPVDVAVRGGGRAVVEPVATADGYAVWVTVADPPEVDIPFEHGLSVLAPDAAASLASLAANDGDWAFRVVGAASSDGDVALNQRLAQQRARVVADALIAGGVPADRVTVDTDARDERVARVVPVMQEVR